MSHRDLGENHVVRSPKDGWETIICRVSHESVSYQKRGAFSYCPLCGTSFEEILGGASA